MKPLLLINFKTYESGTGKNAENLCSIVQMISREEKVHIAVAVQPSDIFRIANKVNIPVFSQHVDNVDFGARTGHILPQAVKEAGAAGTLLNHAERKIPFSTIQETIEKCKNAGLRTVVCCVNMEEAERLIPCKPDYLALEDPELIGTLKSVSRMRPEHVREFANLVKGTHVIPLCGAGIANGEDVKAALDLGTDGGIVATAILKAEDPEKAIREMAQALRGVQE